MKNKYEKRYSNIRVTANDYEMLDDFLRQIRRQSIRLDKGDVTKLGDIVSSYGISIDEEYLESIAEHLEDFMKEVAAILVDSI